MNAPNNGDPTRAELQAELAGLQAQHAADLRSLAELESEVFAERDKVANLEIALGSARHIGAAIGILMASCKLTEDQAFDALRTASRATDRKLRDVAEAVVVAGTLD
jgi:AmiR/NasT family two-component response regulator